MKFQSLQLKCNPPKPLLTIGSIVAVLCCSTLGLNASVHAKSVEVSQATQDMTPPNYFQHPLFIKLLNELERDHQFSRVDLLELFQDVKQQKSILEAMSRPAEKTKTWDEYKPIFVNQTGIDKGLVFWDKHAKTLTRAAKKYQVPEAIIVSIIGVETRYGTYMGKHRIIDSLATLGFDYPARSDFFYGELKNFLILTRQLEWDPLVPKGSYAGAMGFGQFIPSSYLKLAIDFNEDGKTDLIGSVDDAIGSIANYFQFHGWQAGQEVLVPAQLTEQNLSPKAEKLFNKPLKPKVSLAQAAKNGIMPLHPIKDKPLVRPFSFQNAEQTEIWLGLNNFFVITEYNHSKLYARAVYELAKALEENTDNQSAVSLVTDSDRFE